jgi:hypothetical protein
VCLVAAREVLPIWRSYRPLVYERDLANDLTPAWAISLAERQLAGEPLLPAGEADRCSAAATQLRDSTWMNADEASPNATSPVSMRVMARASDVFAALAGAVAWTPGGARAQALVGEEDDAAAAGPAAYCVEAVTGLMGLRGLDFDGVRDLLLSRLAASPPGSPPAT